MKKIISLFISIIMVLSAAGVLAADNPSFTNDSITDDFLAKVSLLTELGVFENEYTTYSQKVTRREFAGFLAGLLGVKKETSDNTMYFEDASENYINNLVSLKIISGCDGGKFVPERIITSGEAVIMVMRALGYRDFIEKRGGGSYEYSREADRIGLDFNRNLNAQLDIKDVAELLFDALDLPILDIKSFSVDSEKIYATYTNIDQVGLLEAYRGLRLIKGQVTANYITSIGDTDAVAREELAINNKIYNCSDLNAFSFIGKRVIAIYDIEQEDIKFVTADYENMRIFELRADEIVEFDDFVLTYQKKSDNKDKKIRLDRRALKVIYNGKAIQDSFKDAFEIDLGTVRLYSSDKSENYKVAVIEEFVDVTVKQASTETLKVYTDDTGDLKTLDFSDVKDKGIYKSFFSAESGLPIGLKSIKQNDLLSVCTSRDKKYIVAYVCTKSVIGSVKASSSRNGTNYVAINDTEYPVSPYYRGLSLTPGRSGKFILDNSGYIGRTEDISHGVSQIAYVYGIDDTEGIFKKEIRLMVYTETKEHLIYYLADTVLYDGIPKTKNEVYTQLTPNAQLSKGLIKYTLNSEGRISVIEAGHGNTNFSEMTSGTQSLKFVEQNRAFGNNGEFVMTMGTKIFMVPRGDERHIPENFNVVNYRESMTPAFTTEETVRIYQDNNDPFAEYVVCFYNNRKTTVYGSGSIHMMVEEVVTKITDDGENLNIIKGYNNCMPYEIAVTDDVQVYAYAGVELKGVEVIEPGDWIVGTTNATGSISYILLMYNADADIFNSSKPGVHAFADSQGKVTNANYYDGDILRVERGGAKGNEVLLVLGNKETGEIRNCIVIDENLMKFMIYDATKRKGNWSVGNVDDIVSLEMTNGERCDRAYFELRSESRLTNVAVYRH